MYTVQGNKKIQLKKKFTFRETGTRSTQFGGLYEKQKSLCEPEIADNLQDDLTPF